MPEIRGSQIKDDSVESIDIKDGTILNIDIADDAAISASKLDISWKSPVAEEAALPESNNSSGDARITTDDGTLYVWYNSQWNASLGGSYSSSDFNTDFATKTTDNLTEGSTNKYFFSHDNTQHTINYLPSSGGTISGNIVPDTTSSRNLGASGLTFANIYCDELYSAASTIHVGSKTISISDDKFNFSSGIVLPSSTTLDTDQLNITSINPADTATLFGTDDSGDSTLHIRIGNGANDKIIIESYNGSSATALMSINQSTVEISGNLHVTGTTTTVDSTTVQVEDSSFVIGNSSPAINKDGTFEVAQASGSAVIKYNYTSNEWETGDSSNTFPIFTALNSKTSGRFYTGTTDPTNTTRLNYDGYFYATRVYNAVCNDYADFQTLDSQEDIEYGNVYYQDKELKKCNKRCQKGVVGIASDTHGIAVGIDSSKKQIPIAVSGWVLAYVDKEYSRGTPLVNNKKGQLTKARLYEKILFPERIVGIFAKTEKCLYWHNIFVNKRYWVKI